MNRKNSCEGSVILWLFLHHCYKFYWAYEISRDARFSLVHRNKHAIIERQSTKVSHSWKFQLEIKLFCITTTSASQSIVRFISTLFELIKLCGFPFICRKCSYISVYNRSKILGKLLDQLTWSVHKTTYFNNMTIFLLRMWFSVIHQNDL